MRVLVVDSFTPPASGVSDGGNQVVPAVRQALQANGNEIDYLPLVGSAFEEFMTEAEWRAYETPTPLQCDATHESADRVRRADGLLFLYPTVLWGVDPVVKSWIERVLVPGVAFTFGRYRLRPGLTHIRRLGAITTAPETRRRTPDLGRRVVVGAIRPNCGKLCRTSYLQVEIDASPATVIDQVEHKLSGWQS